MTITIDDAGSGDLLFGIVIGAYRNEDQTFKYDIIDVKYFQPPLFRQKEYLKQVSKRVFQLLDRLNVKTEEPILICQGSIFDNAVQDLTKKYGEDRIRKIKVVGEAQKFTEMAYLDEIRNLGYEPLSERENKRAKSFYHMLRWIERNPEMIKFVKTGWPRLSKYRFFKSLI